MKLRKTSKFVLATALAAVAVVPFTPIAGASAAPVMSPVQADVAYETDGTNVAIAPCEGVGTTTGSRMTVVYGGTAKAPGAVATVIGCGVKQGGSVVAYSRNALPGPAAATASTASVSVAAYTMCADVSAVFVDGSIVQRHNC